MQDAIVAIDDFAAADVDDVAGVVLHTQALTTAIAGGQCVGLNVQNSRRYIHASFVAMLCPFSPAPFTSVLKCDV